MVVVVVVVVVVGAIASATAPITPSMRPKPNLSWAAFLSARGEEAARVIRAVKRRENRILMPAR